MGANIFKWGQIYLFGSKYTYFLANEKIKILKQILLITGANILILGKTALDLALAKCKQQN